MKDKHILAVPSCLPRSFQILVSVECWVHEAHVRTSVFSRRCSLFLDLMFDWTMTASVCVAAPPRFLHYVENVS